VTGPLVIVSFFNNLRPFLRSSLKLLQARTLHENAICRAHDPLGILENVNPKKELTLVENPSFSVEGSTGVYGADITFKSKDGRFVVDVSASQLHQDYNPTVNMRIYDTTTNQTMRSRGDQSVMIESLMGNTESPGHEITDGMGAGCRLE